MLRFYNSILNFTFEFMLTVCFCSSAQCDLTCRKALKDPTPSPVTIDANRRTLPMEI